MRCASLYQIITHTFLYPPPACPFCFGPIRQENMNLPNPRAEIMSPSLGAAEGPFASAPFTNTRSAVKSSAASPRERRNACAINASRRRLDTRTMPSSVRKSSPCGTTAPGAADNARPPHGFKRIRKVRRKRCFNKCIGMLAAHYYVAYLFALNARVHKRAQEVAVGKVGRRLLALWCNFYYVYG